MNSYCNHCIEQEKNSKDTPTIKAPNVCLPQQDAKKLWETLQAKKVDTDVIINILAKRFLKQRLDISSEYTKLHNSSLVNDLRSKLCGNFKDLIVAMMSRETDFYAAELHRSIAGWGTNESLLIEILCILPSSKINGVKVSYNQIYNKTLESDISDDTSGQLKTFLLSLIQINRQNSTVVDSASAAADARALSRTTKEDQWTVFSRIFTERSFKHLGVVFEKYRDLTNSNIEDHIKASFKGDIDDCLLAIVGFVKNKNDFFATKLRKCVEGLGTQDDNLIRLVVTRSEIDMGDIKKEFMAKYSQTLQEAITNDTSGDYRKCLLLLIGEEEKAKK